MAKFWSAEEVEYLEENWGIKSIPNIAKNINRTVAAVKAKAIKLELGEYNNSGIYITFNQLVKACLLYTSEKSQAFLLVILKCDMLNCERICLRYKLDNVFKALSSFFLC